MDFNTNPRSSQRRKRQEQIAKWKKINPNILACIKCNKSLTTQNITLSLQWKCPRCHEIMAKPNLRPRDILKGHSGKKRRDWTKLVDSTGRTYKTLDNDSLLQILNKNRPDPMAIYKPSIYRLFLRQNAFLAMNYLTATRVSELIGIKEPGKNNKGKYIVYPFNRENIYFDTYNDQKVIVFKDINILKRKAKDSYDTDGIAHKTIPKKTLKLYVEHDMDIIQHIINYLTVMDKLKGNTSYYLFTFCRVTAANYLSNAYKSFHTANKMPETELKSSTPYLHWLRHSRLTYVSLKYKFNDTMVKQYAGWASSLMAAKYVHIDADDLLNVMKMDANN